MTIEHTGDASGTLRLPLRQLWSMDLGEKVAYAVVANGIVVVTTFTKLIALDERTRKRLWSQSAPKGDSWIGPAYDDGKIYVDPLSTLMGTKFGIFAFDERTGKKIWSSLSPGQYGFSAPPTAAAGVVYTVGAGRAGTVYAYDESDGRLKWTASTMSGDGSSPAVTSNGVFVSLFCPWTYDFEPSDGRLIWQHGSSCAGGGGSTPAIYDGFVYAIQTNVSTKNDGVVLTAAQGKAVGVFDAQFTPSFAGKLGFFVHDATLEARNISSQKQIWNASLSSDAMFTTPAAVVGDTVFVVTNDGALIGYDAITGKQQTSIQMSSDYAYGNSFAGIAYDGGELFVPDGVNLVAFEGR